jgi:hypothetical protein
MTLTDEDGNNINNPHGMRKAHRLTVKCEDWYGEIGTDLSVLRRFLQSRVGRPWNEVYSEICAEADYRSFEGHHLREWLEITVEQNCYIEDGEVLDQRGLHVGNFWGEFYVHPETQTLEYVKKTQKYRAPVYEQKVFEMDGHLYHEHEGLWYRVEMEKVAKNTGRYAYPIPHHKTDVFLRDRLDLPHYYSGMIHFLLDKYGRSPSGSAWFCVGKESANSKEIARIKKIKSAA